MNHPLHFLTIERPAVAEYKDKGSKFIGYAYPLASPDAFKKHLALLRKEHPKAAHHCFAYRLGVDGNNFRASDDGEPSGTAGRPILGQIDSKGLTNVLVIVVRYFGGTLLGVPGLINAYKTTAALSLQLTPIVTKKIMVPYTLHFDYTRLNEVMVLVKQYACEILHQESTLFCNMTIGVSKEKEKELIVKLNELQVGQVQAV